MAVDFAIDEPYDYRYIDSDVRADPTLRELVVQYLNQYDGEFEPLVDAQIYLKTVGDDLPVAVVRKVLNCMRNDLRVRAQLPRPDRKRALVKPQRNPDLRQCDRLEPHTAHQWHGGWCYYNCSGVKWAINRYHILHRDAVIKYPFVVSRTGRFVHRTEGTGIITWYPNSHDWGFEMITVSVRTFCNNPGSISSAILLKAEPEYNGVFLGNERSLSRCMRCF